MSETQTLSSAFRQYYDLTKPRVVMLIVFTAIVGMLLAVQGIPDLKLVLIASFGIGLAASAGAVMNQIIDMRADAIMARTQNRPLATGGFANVAGNYFCGCALCVRCRDTGSLGEPLNSCAYLVVYGRLRRYLYGVSKARKRLKILS